mgnify:CR=1 FL=1
MTTISIIGSGNMARAIGTRAARGAHGGLDGFHQGISGIDVDTRLLVRKTF